MAIINLGLFHDVQDVRVFLVYVWERPALCKLEYPWGVAGPPT